MVVVCTRPLSKLYFQNLYLWDKVKYIVHYRNLKLYLQLGFVVTKMHSVLTFKQSPWLKTYIDFNTRQHSLAGDSFLKDFFKSRNNSVFGKTQENLRNHVSVKLIRDTRNLHKQVSKPRLLIVWLPYSVK